MSAHFVRCPTCLHLVKPIASEEAAVSEPVQPTEPLVTDEQSIEELMRLAREAYNDTAGKHQDFAIAALESALRAAIPGNQRAAVSEPVAMAESHARWLEQAAAEIAKAGHVGWGNTCLWAAEYLRSLAHPLVQPTEPVAWRYQPKRDAKVWAYAEVKQQFHDPSDWIQEPLYAHPPVQPTVKSLRAAMELLPADPIDPAHRYGG